MPRTSGVFPVYENQFAIGTAGRASTSAEMKPIADMESFSVSFDNGVEEWTPMTTEGWIRRLMTGKGLTIGINGKRNVGDVGNDYIATRAWKKGDDVNSVLRWTFPDGASVDIPCVINVKTVGTGDSKNVGPLEFEALSDGKPTLSTEVISIDPINDITIGLTSFAKIKLAVDPPDAALTAAVTQLTGTGGDVTATIAGGVLTVTSTAGVAGETYRITVTGTKAGYTAASESLVVTLAAS